MDIARSDVDARVAIDHGRSATKRDHRRLLMSRSSVAEAGQVIDVTHSLGVALYTKELSERTAARSR